MDMESALEAEDSGFEFEVVCVRRLLACSALLMLTPILLNPLSLNHLLCFFSFSFHIIYLYFLPSFLLLSDFLLLSSFFSLFILYFSFFFYFLLVSLFVLFIFYLFLFSFCLLFSIFSLILLSLFLIYSSLLIAPIFLFWIFSSYFKNLIN
jgi:hypothetical protein